MPRRPSAGISADARTRPSGMRCRTSAAPSVQPVVVATPRSNATASVVPSRNEWIASTGNRIAAPSRAARACIRASTTRNAVKPTATAAIASGPVSSIRCGTRRSSSSGRTTHSIAVSSIVKAAR